MIRFAVFVLCLLPALMAGMPARAQNDAQQAALRQEMTAAIEKVAAIVNQPITRLPRTSVANEFSPGWFHQGATKPDFNKVDIRKTRKLSYAQFSYVTSDLNPTEMFIGRELEFNPMTKYFYIDYTTPKKRLSEAEMVEINRLYRIIGHCEKQLGRTSSGPASPGMHPALPGALGGLALLGTIFFLKRKKPAPKRKRPASVRK